MDLLLPGVTEKFLDVTMAAYQREVGKEFGKRIPGVFTDEPHLRPAGGLHWTEDLPQQFQQRRDSPPYPMRRRGTVRRPRDVGMRPPA